ncbi:MAG: transcriptional repressor [Actinobacteria bacterium]|nr:transcriptional repressor [Actinomycetota bacterium]
MNQSYYDFLTNLLIRKGFRLTVVRKAIIRELDNAKRPLSTGELRGCLQKSGLSPHKTTVYREIGFLLDQGIVTRLTFGERQDRFELSLFPHHHHAVCEKCGVVEDIDCAEGISKIEDMLSRRKFKVKTHMVEFIGLCDHCR